MNIRIDKLHLVNFKGIRDLEVTFGGANAVMAGDNGTGKTTLFDAFTWLLFGKDSRDQDQTKFDITPIDPVTGEVIHRCDTVVTAVLDVDGSKQKLSRVWRETWRRATGETESTMSGHESSYFVNDINVGTKKAYDEIVGGWMSEDVFRMITSPLYFIDNRFTGWESRRNALISLAGTVDKSELRSRFSELLDAMNGTSLTAFRKKITAEKRADKAELAKVEPSVNAYRRAMPDPVDIAALDEEESRIRSEHDEAVRTVTERIRAMEAEIERVRLGDRETEKAVGELKTRIQDVRRTVAECRRRRDAMVEEAVSSARERNAALAQTIRATEDEMTRRDSLIQSYVRSGQEAALEAQTHARRQDELKRCVEEFRAGYLRVKAEEFSGKVESVCPACGQPLPEDRVAEAAARAKAAFVLDQKNRLASIRREAEDLKARYETEVTKESSCMLAKEEAERKVADLEEKQKQSRLYLNSLTSTPAESLDAVRAGVTTSEGYAALVADESEAEEVIAGLEAKITEYRMADTTALQNERNGLTLSLSELRSRLNDDLKDIDRKRAMHAERERIQRLIDEELAKESRLADRIAEIERMEWQAAAYAKADMELIENAINSHFRLTRWRMFETTMDGEQKECCEAMDLHGVPYKSLNDAKRILVGLDVIRAFCDFYGVTAPIFVDNGESITARDFDVESQVIRLNVDEQYPQLTKIA